MAVLVRSAGPITQNVSARELEVHFPFPGWFGESRPMCLVQHRDDSTLPPDRLVAGDLLHSESLKGSRNVALSDVVRRGFLRNVVGHILDQSRR